MIAENDHGWKFGVARISGGDRWIGFAYGKCEQGVYMEIMPAVAEGIELGMLDRDEAIRLTYAIAADAESAYGGIARSFVDETLRGDPDYYRCDGCDQVGCQGDCGEWDAGNENWDDG